MPIATIAQAVQRAQLRHPSVDTNLGVSFAVEVYRELLQNADIGRASVTVSVTAGVSDYALPAGVFAVYSADYRDTATAAYRLEAAPADWFDMYAPAYRSVARTGKPHSYALVQAEATGTKPRLRLFPAPDVTTASGFPSVLLHVGQEPAVMDGTTPLPERVASLEVFVDGVLAKWARLFSDQDFPELDRRYRESFDRAIAALHSVSRAEPTVVVPKALSRYPQKR